VLKNVLLGSTPLFVGIFAFGAITVHPCQQFGEHPIFKSLLRSLCGTEFESSSMYLAHRQVRRILAMLSGFSSALRAGQLKRFFGGGHL